MNQPNLPAALEARPEMSRRYLADPRAQPRFEPRPCIWMSSSPALPCRTLSTSARVSEEN